VNSLFKLLSNRHEKATQQRRLIALFDEAHTWMEVLEGEFPRASTDSGSVKTGRKRHKKNVTRPMLSAAIETLRFLPKSESMWVGTALSLRHFEQVQSATGWRSEKLFLNFSILREEDVHRLLGQYINWKEIDDETELMLTTELKGRARLAAGFVADLLRQESEVDLTTLRRVFTELRTYMTDTSKETDTLLFNWSRVLNPPSDIKGDWNCT
jgi:hypothetical protein